MTVFSRASAFGVLILCAVSAASAEIVQYQVTVDTGTIFGTAGSFDLNFNPGPLTSQFASLQLLKFTSNGTLASSPILGGDISGNLPSPLTFDNAMGLNDYFEGFTFGKTLSFELSFYGPALSAPDGTSTSGSTFAFSMFSNKAGTIPALTRNTTDGFAFTVDVNLAGTTTVTNWSTQTTVLQESAVPEPRTVLQFGMVFGLMVSRFWSQSRRRANKVFASSAE